MQGPSWIALLQRIPTQLHDTVALTLVTGAEILMQSILRLESDFAIMRGRMSGSTDAGKVLILPYDQIVNLAFTKRMLEPEVQAIFGKTLESPTGQSAAPAKDEQVPTEATEPADEVEQDVPTRGVAMEMQTALPTQPSSLPVQAAGPGKNSPPSKSILLARLRARLAEQGK